MNEKKPRTLVSDVYSTKVYTTATKIIAAKTTIKESRGKGMINQILLKSNSQAYTLKVMIDDSTIYDATFAFFLANTADIDNISAYVVAGVNYLTIQDLSFQKNFRLSIHPTTSITFNLLYARYNIIDEVVIKELI